MVSTVLKMKNLYSSTASHYIVRNKKMFGRPFCFPIGICSYSFIRALDGASFEKSSTFIICLSRDIDILTHPEYKKIEK